MIKFTEISVSPAAIIAWLFVGLIAGWLAARVMKGGGYGMVADMVVGLLGAVIGGLVFAIILAGKAGFWVSIAGIAVAIVGAWILIAITRFLGFGRRGI